jgi:hypothetical protein
MCSGVQEGMNEIKSSAVYVHCSACCSNLEFNDVSVLRRIFGPKRDEMVGGWRKLHNEELHNLCSSPNIIRMITSRKTR